MATIRSSRPIVLVTWGVAVLSLLALTGVVSSGSAAAQASSDGPYRAVIRRTAYGIPHIQATDFGGLGYGYGYAFAQDNICSLEQQVLTAEGSRSLHFGASASAGDALNLNVTNLDSDVYYRSLNDSGVLQRLVDRPMPIGPSADVRRLVAGYAAGINQYLKVTGVDGISDPTCRAKPWVRAVTELDIYRLTYNLSQVAGTEALKKSIANARPATTTGPATTAASAAELPAALPPPSQFGSNAIAVGRDGSADGHGLVLANPHFPWFGDKRFYQVQLTIPGQINVSGVSLYGTPMVEIGHSQRVAWSHTVSTAQRFTMYDLKLAPGDPTSYVVDGQVEAMTRRTVTVPVGPADAADGVITRTLYSSRYGPLLATNWTNTSALAVRGANVNNLRAPDEWLAMSRADSIAALRAAQNRFQGIPFVNTTAADSTGRTYISDASVVPNVTDELVESCVTTPIGKALYPDQTVLDGSTTGCVWPSDPDAIEPGIVGPSRLPALERTDFVTNSNDSLWLANPAQPLTEYPRIFGPTVEPSSLRTRLGLAQIQGRIDGTDGRPGRGFTTTSLAGAVLSDRNYSADLTRDAVVRLCRENPELTGTDGQPVDVRAACTALADWDGRADPDSRGAVLWREFWIRTLGATDLWLVPFDPAHPTTTPNTLNPDSVIVRRALADATARLRTVGVAVDAPLSAAQRTTVAGGQTPVPGCTGMEGCYNVVTGAGNRTGLTADGTYPDLAFGTSFLMSVDLGPKGPSGRTLLTYSQSADPSSPHHGDQTRLFAEKTMIKDRYAERDILSDPELEVTVLRR